MCCSQGFSAIFEAAIDGLPQNQQKGRNLTFEVAGEGNLPRISIVKPSVRNKKGQPLLLFKRNLIGRTQALPLVIINDGTLPSKVGTLYTLLTVNSHLIAASQIIATPLFGGLSPS